MPAAGVAPASTGRPPSAPRCSPASNTADRRSRSRAGSAARLRRAAGQAVITHETNYRFSYTQTTHTNPDRAWRQTITFDIGTEFARRYHLHALGIETFFCDPEAP